MSSGKKGSQGSSFAAKTNDICINDLLLKGPDRNNSLRGVLQRFRRHPYAVTADIENMFHQFAIPEDQRTYLRFFWYKDNDPKKEIIEYYSRVHLMGLRSSPAIANVGIRYAARKDPPKDGHTWIAEDDLLDPYQRNATRTPDDIEKMLSRHFYVDDLLNSHPTPQEALYSIREGISRLQRYDLKLCKVQSNADLVRKAFPSKELLPNLMELKPADNTDSEQDQSSSLGLQWNIKEDIFGIKMQFKERPKTKRGFLGHMMSPYDPIGIASPALLSCKLLQREIFPPKDQDPHRLHALGWDDPIPSQFDKQWKQTIKACQDVQKLTIPRSFYPKGHGTPKHQQIFAFADASDLAISYVVYLRTETTDGTIHVALLCGNPKVLPKGVSIKGQLSIPRAELNAARDLSAQVLQIETDLDIANLHPTQYFTDSLDVLAWINNNKDATKRYVTSRINTIRKILQTYQWQYIPTVENPADIGTRPISVEDLQASMWFTGPPFLRQDVPIPPTKTETQSPATMLFTAPLGSFFLTKTRYANEDITMGAMWKRLLDQIQTEEKLPNARKASIALERRMQREEWPKGLASITQLDTRYKRQIMSKTPFLDTDDELIKVGGRLELSDLTFGRKHPTLIPDTESGDALIGYLHSLTEHQGRKTTSSAIREQGYYPIGGRKRIDRIISNCISCRTIRAPLMTQKMADFPEQRLHRTPPFYHCGIDVFGHFFIRHGKPTRANPGTQKVWVLIFSCLYTRAVHLEILDSMDTSSFKQAFQRFQALRGDCAYLRSDAGSNFMGARNEKCDLSDEVIEEVKHSWEQQGKIWDVNPPVASHFGGVWERAIGQVRQIIENYLVPKQQRLITREEFHTMLLHCARIMNSTPLHDPPESPDEPDPSLHIVLSLKGTMPARKHTAGRLSTPLKT